VAIRSNVTKEQIEYYTNLCFWDKWTFCDYIKRWAVAFPNKEALIDVKTRLTWSQYKTMMDRMALNFLELGIKKDDLVVTQIPNCVEAIITEMALARIGACVVPLAMQWREHELNYVLGQTESPAVIIAKEYANFNYVNMMKGLQGKHSKLKHLIVLGDDVPEGTVSFKKLWENKLEEKSAPDYLDKNFKIDANDVLTMCFTSGTEADPKGCPRTHNHWKAFERSAFLHHLTENVHDKVVMALPWINLFGQSVGILSMAMVGGTVILLDGFNPAVMAQTISKEKATLYAGVPAMHIALLNYPELDKYDLSSLRVVASGGAPSGTGSAPTKAISMSPRSGWNRNSCPRLSVFRSFTARQKSLTKTTIFSGSDKSANSARRRRSSFQGITKGRISMPRNGIRTDSTIPVMPAISMKTGSIISQPASRTSSFAGE
jgi:acyl-CoA synthetase (AMP-forming)/AMP-acid ligase II